MVDGYMQFCGFVSCEPLRNMRITMTIVLGNMCLRNVAGNNDRRRSDRQLVLTFRRRYLNLNWSIG